MLHTLRPARGAVRLRKRVGRGPGSGQGTTAGRGTKGQHARTGKGQMHGFEGGQVPLIRRQPKLGGFTPPNSFSYEPINLSTLEQMLEPGSYDVPALRRRKIVRSNRPVKILGNAVSKKFTLTVHAASKAAKAALTKAGGSVTIVRA